MQMCFFFHLKRNPSLECIPLSSTTCQTISLFFSVLKILKDIYTWSLNPLLPWSGFYCCSCTVVSISPQNYPHPTQASLPPSNQPPLALYMFLNNPSPIFPIVLVPSPLWLLFFLYFNVSGYILLACLFCSLGLIYR